MILRSIWKRSRRRRRTGLKQKHFGMRRRTTGLEHLCDKNYNVAEDKWTVVAVAVMVVEAGGGARVAGGGARRGQTMAVDVRW
jgi:hypothetical protein